MFYRPQVFVLACHADYRFPVPAGRKNRGVTARFALSFPHRYRMMQRSISLCEAASRWNRLCAPMNRAR